MGEITRFTKTLAVFCKENIFIHKNKNYSICFTSVLLKDEEKRCWSDEMRCSTCPLFTDSYNIFRESCLVFQRFHVTRGMRNISRLSHDDVGGYLERNDAYEGLFGYEISRLLFCRLSVRFSVTIEGR